MELLKAITLAQWSKWLALLIGALQLVATFLVSADFSVGAIVTLVAAIVLFIINGLANKAALRYGVKK